MDGRCFFVNVSGRSMTIAVRIFLMIGVSCLLLTSCERMQPEVVIVNKIAEHVLVGNPSFNGCVWNTVLVYGEATSPRRCLVGEGRAHFRKFDAFNYCREQKNDGTIDGLCPCDTMLVPEDSGLINTTPFFFNYQTISITDAQTGDIIIIELHADDVEQDFSKPGPYGH